MKTPLIGPADSTAIQEVADDVDSTIHNPTPQVVGPAYTRQAAFRLSTVFRYLLLAYLAALFLGSCPVAFSQSVPVAPFDPKANGPVYSMAVLPDGSILVAGSFSLLGGHACTNLGRLTVTGLLDTAFNPSVSGSVRTIAVQPDGRILIGGAFDRVGNQRRGNLARLNSDGTLDEGFDFAVDGFVSSLLLQADARILVGGLFNYVQKQSRKSLARLTADGTLDADFNPGVGGSYPVVHSLVLQPDGKILVGGGFERLGGYGRMRIGRLNPDGKVDESFNPGANFGDVHTMAVQADGRILVAGQFVRLGGQSRRDIGRLNADGTVDPAFDPGVAGDYAVLHSLALQADGKIVVAGEQFSTIGGQNRTNLCRLNPDGTVDPGFIVAANGPVFSLALERDGGVLVGGSFSLVGAETRSSIGRIAASEPGSETLGVVGQKLTWMRAGGSPEVWRTTFEYSSDGNTWILLGDGARTQGGWELDVPPLPLGTSLRARGYTQGGDGNAGSWYVESASGRAVLVRQPVSMSRPAGGTAVFDVRAIGGEDSVYHWYKNGRRLSDQGKVFGSSTPRLELRGVLGADAGGYSVVLADRFGSVTSTVASLTVQDPVILVPPISQIRNPGDSATLSCKAFGTEPLAYQWRKDGVAIPGATQPSMSIAEVGGRDGGRYDVEVISIWGSALSEAAMLWVDLSKADGFNPGASDAVWSLAVLADGSILAGGGFNVLAGQACTNIGRLSATGNLDATFRPSVNGSVYCIAVQTDGRILIGGSFTRVGDQNRNHFARLEPDGKLDPSFDPDSDEPVFSLCLQADGKIIAGGRFSFLGGQSRNSIARLNQDGTLDLTFNPGAGGSYPMVHCLVMQSDGKVLVGGGFDRLGGLGRSRIGRLNPDGTTDKAFNPGADLGGVYAMAVRPDGKILVAGQFRALGGLGRRNVGLLNPDGTADPGFNPGVAGDYAILHSLALQADGRVVVGGELFSAVGGQSRTNICRLNKDGSVDPSFNPGANGYVYCLALQHDGRILAGGSFRVLGGEDRTCIGRLHSSEPATQILRLDGAKITWMRAGTSPEVWRTEFELSTPSGKWISLGAGQRLESGWELEVSSLPIGASIRARGYTQGGGSSSCSWFLESVINPILVISSPILYPNGKISFASITAADQQFVVEESTDLERWTPLLPNAVGAGEQTLIRAADTPQRFFRLRSIP